MKFRPRPGGCQRTSCREQRGPNGDADSLLLHQGPEGLESGIAPVAVIAGALYTSCVKVLFYASDSGRVPVREFLSNLPTKARAECFRVLERIEEEGLDGQGFTTRQIRKKLWEIKIRAGGEVRIFYCVLRSPATTTSRDRVQGASTVPEEVDESTVVLLHAYLKKTRKAPHREIDTAERRMKEVES